jgi:type IV pilus assembly protein PilM
MARAVGLDIGSRTLKAVLLSGSAKAFKVQRVLIRPMPEGVGRRDAAVADLVKEVFAEGRLPKDDVCSAFDAGTTIFREITVPMREPEKIEKIIRFEAENHLHGRAIEDVVVNWVKTADTKEGSQVLIFAAPKTELAADLANLRRAGIEPASVDLDATALFTACQATGVFTEHPNVLVIEVGARTTNLLLVSEGGLRAVRSFLVGSETVTSGIQQDLSLPQGEAAAHAMRAGPDAGDLLVPAASPATSESGKSVAELERDVAGARREEFVKKLQREITRTITSARVAAVPERILLSGGGAMLPGLGDSLAEKMGVQVQPLGLLSRLGWRSGAANPVFEEAVSPVAVGCALRVLGADPLGVELRQEEFAPTNTFDVVRGVLAVSVTLLVALLGGILFMQRQALTREQVKFRDGISRKAVSIFEDVERGYLMDRMNKGEAEAKDQAAKARTRLTFDENYLITIRNHLIARYRELEDNLGLSKDVPAVESALKVWVEVYSALDSIPRAELGWFRVNNFSVNLGSATLTVEVANLDVLDRVERAIGENAYLRGRAKRPQSVATRMTFNKVANTTHFAGAIEINFREPGE